MHAKSVVVDNELAYIGSFNFDPRSINLNTEIGVIIKDPTFAALITQSLKQDMSPRNSWQVAPRRIPLRAPNRFAESISRHLPLDIWPISSTAIFASESEEWSAALPDPNFYDTYTSVGVLPHKDFFSGKRWFFRLYKTLGLIMTPFT